MFRKILALVAGLTLSVACVASQQVIVSTPGSATTAPQAAVIINSNFGELYSRITGALYLAPSGDTTGVTDLANLQAAAATLAATFRLPPGASSFVPTGKIILGPGTFYFTQSNVGLLPATSLKMSGFWLQGSGRGVSLIDYNPTISGPLFTNQKWLDVKMSDITFVGHDPNSDFLWSQEQAGISNIQDYTFEDVEWGQTWNDIIRITGGNNNSEWKFERSSVGGSIANWIYVPPAIATVITSGSSIIGLGVTPNTLEQVEVGDTGSFNAAVAPLSANTQYYVVVANSTGFQVATTPGGTPVSFTASGTPSFKTGSDQFLNFWFHQCKFDTGTSLGQWINMSFGGSIKIKDCDASAHAPPSVAYMFNLLGNAHAAGVQNFEVDGLRVEHSSTNSRLIHSQWAAGSISFNNLDESSQAGRWPITNQYALYEVVNVPGAQVTYTNSALMGQHAYTNNVSNFNFQSDILYQQDTLIENPTAANFIALTSVGNSGGFPRIKFSKVRNGLSAATVGYHEIVDTDLFWNKTSGGQTDTKVVSCVGTNSDFPTAGGSIQFRLPLNAMIQRVRFWNPTGSGVAGTFQYTVQTTEATPTVLAGGAGTPMAGTNASTPIPASSMYVTTPNFIMTTDAARTIIIQDTLAGGRSGIYTGPFCLIDYIG